MATRGSRAIAPANRLFMRPLPIGALSGLEHRAPQPARQRWPNKAAGRRAFDHENRGMFRVPSPFPDENDAQTFRFNRVG
jgi:hypothetical protein